MALSTPWFASCAAAAVTGLLALTTGTAAIPSASPLPSSVTAVTGAEPAALAAPALRRAALHNAASAAAQATAGGATRTATTPATPGAPAAPLATTGGRSVTQHLALSRGASDEEALRSRLATVSDKSVIALRQGALASAKRLRPTPTPAPAAAATTTPTTPAPTDAATPVETVLPSALPSVLPTVDPSPTATATATPTATATATPTATATATATPTVTSSPTPSASPTATSPSGQSVPSADLPGWKLAMNEDFNTPAPIGSFMTTYAKTIDSYKDGWVDTARVGTYFPSKVVSAHDGMMDYYLHTENGVHMVAAEMPKLPNGQYGQAYGRYAVRFSNDVIPGYKSAWLLWPNSESWPNDGEIDFPEANLSGSDTINAFSHHASANGGQDWFGSSTHMTGGWHTAVVEWAPGSVSFSLDGAKLGTSTTMTPSTAMHWVLQTETSPGTVPLDSTSGHVYIDWVAQWSKA
jgi:hypothetical protein